VQTKGNVAETTEEERVQAKGNVAETAADRRGCRRKSRALKLGPFG